MWKKQKLLLATTITERLVSLPQASMYEKVNTWHTFAVEVSCKTSLLTNTEALHVFAPATATRFDGFIFSLLLKYCSVRKDCWWIFSADFYYRPLGHSFDLESFLRNPVEVSFVKRQAGGVKICASVKHGWVSLFVHFVSLAPVDAVHRAHDVLSQVEQQSVKNQQQQLLTRLLHESLNSFQISIEGQTI